MEPSILNPPVPYIGFIQGGFRHGRIVRVQGRVNHNSHGFKIELLCGSNPNHDDVALHFNPRFSESVVIRNSRNYSSWGTEERTGTGFPFVRGQVFEVLLLCEREHFKIAINGQHYAEFSHRVPVERITHIAVDGDITISFVQFDGASESQAPESVASAPPLLQGGHYGEPYPSYAPLGHVGHGQAPGFVPPPYPASGAMGAPPFPPQQPGGYPPPMYGGPPMHGGYPGPGHAYPSPSGGYPGYYPPPQQQHGNYPNHSGGYPGAQQYPPQQQGSGGGLMDTAGKMLAGVGLAGVASKLPGMLGGRGQHQQGYGHGVPGGYPGGHGSGGGGFPGGAVAGLGALGIGGALAAKALKPKKMKKNKKMLKYGLPLAGVGLGGYAMHKGMHGFRRRSSSSSSSSSSD